MDGMSTRRSHILVGRNPFLQAETMDCLLSFDINPNFSSVSKAMDPKMETKVSIEGIEYHWEEEGISP